MTQLMISPFNDHILIQGKQTDRLAKDVSVQATIITPSGYCSVPILVEEDSDGRSVWQDQPDFDDMTDFGYLYYKNRHNQTRETWSPPGYGDDD